MSNKITLRIPTKDQYAFVELVLEDATAEEAKEYYDNWTNEFTRENVGISPKDFCAFLDCYLTTGKPPENGLVVWEEMSHTQRLVINEVKKCFKRINKQ